MIEIRSLLAHRLTVDNEPKTVSGARERERETAMLRRSRLNLDQQSEYAYSNCQKDRISTYEYIITIFVGFYVLSSWGLL